MRASLLAVLALTLTWCASPALTMPAVGYDNQRAVDDPIVALTMDFVNRYWQHANVAGASAPVTVADRLDSVGLYDGQGVVLDGRRVGEWLGNLRNPQRTRHQQRRNLRRLYVTLAHEQGHARGLPHTSGIMGDTTNFRQAPKDWRDLLAAAVEQGLVPEGRRAHTARGGPRTPGGGRRVSF